MARKLVDPMYHWKTHKCWHCGTRSIDQKTLKMVSLGNAFICVNCYSKLFGDK